MRTSVSLFLTLLFLLFSPSPISAIDFVYNEFNASDFLLFGDATVKLAVTASGSRSYLSLAEPSPISVGRAFHKTKVVTRTTNGSGPGGSSRALPFSASFLFSIAKIPGVLPGHGITFLFAPVAGIDTGTEAQQLGLFNFTTNGDVSNGVFAVEFDLFRNPEFNDIDENHVGIDINSLTSRNSSPAGYWPDATSPPSFVPLRLNDGTNYQAWVDYSGDGMLTVSMAPAGISKPKRPLLTLHLDLSDVFKDEMYVGFSGATGVLVENHRILGWSFSNTNFSLSKALITSNLPNFVPKELKKYRSAMIAGISSGVIVMVILGTIIWCFIQRRRRRRRNWRRSGGIELGESGDEAETEDWELEYWPHRIEYKDIVSGTGNFSDDNLIGAGGDGKVYRGLLSGIRVAVKLFARNSGEEARMFLSEVSSIGRLKHRNLVSLRGWCRKRGGELILVYEYMENGSLDKKIFPFPSSRSPPLDWASRVRILKDVAAGVLYLHEGWESQVLHRDIKASNVMLDGDMVGRLGDFGLARIYAHDGGPRTTKVIGTVGYMAPEVVRTGKSTSATDVYGFGVLILEVVCGRRPVEEGLPGLIDWGREMWEKGEISRAIDPRVKASSGYDEKEAVRIMRLGLVCTCSVPASRPTMRQVVRALDGGTVESDGVDERSTEMYLVEKLKTIGIVGTTPRWSPAARCRHLTFDDVKQSLSGSPDLSASDVIMEGR